MIKKVIFGTKVINHKKFRITSIFFSSIYKVDIYIYIYIDIFFSYERASKASGKVQGLAAPGNKKTI